MKKKQRFKERNKSWAGRFWSFVWKMCLAFFLLSLLWVLTLRFVNPPGTFLMIQRTFNKDIKGNRQAIKHTWLDYEQLSDHLKRAAIASEDAHFLEHRGFDFEAIRKAYKKNQTSKKLWGGSTISQQTAKNVFLWPQRSWLRKGFETYFTVLIEVIWGKKRILEVYLNMIETGDHIFGMEAAAQHYFKKSAAKVTRDEAARLIAVLPNPRRWNPARPTAYINRKKSTILRYINHYDIP